MRFISDNQKVDKGKGTSLQVIAAGLPRCATSSIQAAFENDLGLYPSMHMAHVMPYVERLKIARACILELDKAKRQAMLHELFDGYLGTADFPGCFFVPDLIEMYPGAKVVLNKRKSPEAWLKSITGTLKYFGSKTYFWTTCLIPNDYWHHQIHLASAEYCPRVYGTEGIFDVAAYEKHFQIVKDVCDANGTEWIEFEPSMGWDPLCKFLGKPAPNKPFPHLNDEATLKVLITIVTLRGLAAWAGVLALPVLASWLARKWFG